LIFEEFNPKIHDYHKVAEFIYSVDFRTYDEVFKTKEKAIEAIEELLLVEGEDFNDEDLDEDEKSNTALYVVLDDEEDSDNNTKTDKYINSLDISPDNTMITNEEEDNNPKHIIGMLQVIRGRKDSVFGDILYLISKLRSAYALKFSYIYFLDSLVLANLNEDDLYIAEIAIDECKRGKGLGTLVIKKVIERAKKKGYKRVVLDTDYRNENAYKLYESLGFRKFGKKKSKFFKKDRQMYNMEYIL